MINLLKELEKKNYIKKIKKSSINVENSLDISKRDLKLSKTILKEDYDWAFNVAYNSILQCICALMFSQGYRPSSGISHVATIEFAKIYLNNSDTIYLNNMRKSRHKATYDIVGIITESQAKNAICHSEEIIKKITKIIEKNTE